MDIAKCKIIRCSCGNVIAIDYGDYIITKKKGREITINKAKGMSASVLCERCRKDNKLDCEVKTKCQ